MAKPFDVNDSDFSEKVENSEKPVLVDFWAEWCMPCKMIAPMVDELAEEYDGQVVFTKLDVDSSPNTATKYGVRSIPTLLIFKDGKPVQQVVGAMPKSALKERIDSALSD